MNRTLRAIIAVVDRATAPIRRIRAVAQTLTAPIRAFGRSILRVADEAGLGRLRDGFVGVGRAVGDLGRRLGRILAPLGAILGVASVAGLAALTRGFAEAANKLVLTAQGLGVTTDALQELRYAAQSNGVEVEALDKSLENLNKRMAAAAAGKDKDLAELFRRLGIELRNADGSLRNAAEVLPEIAEGFRLNSDQGLRARMAAKLFGDDLGQKLIPLLSQGGDELKRLSDRAHELGAVVSGPELQRASDFADHLEDLGVAAKGLGNAVASQLVPILSPLVQDLTAWIAANRELIAQKVGEVVQAFARALESVNWQGIWDTIKGVGASVASVVEFFGGWEVAAIALAGVMNAGLIGSIAGVVAALGKLGIILLTNPLGLVLAAIAGAAVLIMTNWQGLADFFATLWEGVKRIFKDAWDWINVEVIKPMRDAVQWVKDAASDLNPFSEENSEAFNRSMGFDQTSSLLDTLGMTRAEAAPARVDGRVETIVRFLGLPPGAQVSQRSEGQVEARAETGLNGLWGMP